jgi:hypothetical protein
MEIDSTPGVRGYPFIPVAGYRGCLTSLLRDLCQEIPIRSDDNGMQVDMAFERELYAGDPRYDARGSGILMNLSDYSQAYLQCFGKHHLLTRTIDIRA